MFLFTSDDFLFYILFFFNHLCIHLTLACVGARRCVWCLDFEKFIVKLSELSEGPEMDICLCDS